MVAAIGYRPIPITDLGPLSVSLHGLGAGIGFAFGVWLMLREVDRRGFDSRQVVTVLAWVLLGAVVGARLFTIPVRMFDAGYGLDDVLTVSGTQSSLGGYAGGIIAALIALWRLDLAILPHLDMAAPSLAVGVLFARLGDMAIVEHLGSETTFFLGYSLLPGYEIAPQHFELQQACDLLGQCGAYHHTALYDFLGAAVLVGFLWSGAGSGEAAKVTFNVRHTELQSS